MKKILLSLLCMAGITAHAQSIDYLTFRAMDGSEVSLPIDGLKITFDNATMHAAADKQTVDFKLSDLSMMFFSATPTAVESVEAAPREVAIVNGKVWVNGAEAVEAQVYTMDGRSVESRLLSRGAYIVKVNGKTYKLMAR